MKVYCVHYRVAYHGDTLRGIYKDRSSAINYVDEYCREHYDEIQKDYDDSWDLDYKFVITEMEVK